MLRSMFVCAVFLAGCARGGDASGSDALKNDAAEHKDASTATNDSAPHSDASTANDATVVDAKLPDAAVDAASAFFCTDNAQCTNAGECCLPIIGICGKGAIVFGACIPQ